MLNETRNVVGLDVPAQVGMSEMEIETPALVVDLECSGRLVLVVAAGRDLLRRCCFALIDQLADAALASQLTGLYWQDGGPVVSVQVRARDRSNRGCYSNIPPVLILSHPSIDKRANSRAKVE